MSYPQRPTGVAKAFYYVLDGIDAVARAARFFVTSTRGAWALAMQYRDSNREMREAMERREELLRSRAEGAGGLRERAVGDWPYDGGLRG